MKTIRNLLTAALLAPTLLLAADPPSIAVVNFSGREYPQLVKKIPELMEHGLINGGRFTVVERAKLPDLIQEGALQHSGFVDPAEQIRLGKLSGARYLLTGSIVDAGTDEVNTEAYGVRLTTITKRCDIRIKVLDTETGRHVFSGLADGSYVSHESSNRRTSGDGPWMTMARDLSGKLVRQLNEAEFLKAYQPAVEARAKVRFETDPAGASIEIGEILVGNGGRELDVPAGLQTIKVTKSGYEPWIKKADLRDGLVIEVALERRRDPDMKIAVERTTTAQVKSE